MRILEMAMSENDQCLWMEGLEDRRMTLRWSEYLLK